MLSACSGALSVSPGEAVTPPELGAPTIDVVVLAADDLGALPSRVSADGIELAVSDQSAAVVTWEGLPIHLTIDADGFRPTEFMQAQARIRRSRLSQSLASAW